MCEGGQNFNKKQNPNTGLWEADVNYRTVSGLMKIGGMYNSLKRELPNADKAVRSALDTATSDKPLTEVVYVYNPLVAINNTLSNINNYGTSENGQAIREAVYKETRERALELIENTKQKLSVFKKADGSLSYGATSAPSKSQGAPVCFDANEGDVNGSGLCNGTITSLFSVLGLSRPNYYDAQDRARFIEIIMNKEPVKKITGDKTSIYFESMTKDTLPKTLKVDTASEGSDYKLLPDTVNGKQTTVLELISKSGANDKVEIMSAENLENPALYILKADMCVTPDKDNTASALVQIRIDGSYQIVLEIKNGKLHIYDSSSTGSGNQTTDLGIYLELGEWFNLRIEYSVGTKSTAKARVYINDKLAATSSNYYGAKTGSNPSSWPNPQNKYNKAVFQTLNAASLSLRIDNIFVDAKSTDEVK